MLVEIARKYPEIQFCFAGAKREDTNIAFPKNVQLMGYLKGKDLEHFIKNARLVVIPSRCYEGFPMAILEAAQFGKPCVCPDHGGFTEIIGKGENTIGRLFEPNNLNDLEKQILALWNQPVLVEELGQKAYEKLQKEYSSEVVYNKWNELFTKILYG